MAAQWAAIFPSCGENLTKFGENDILFDVFFHFSPSPVYGGGEMDIIEVL